MFIFMIQCCPQTWTEKSPLACNSTWLTAIQGVESKGLLSTQPKWDTCVSPRKVEGTSWKKEWKERKLRTMGKKPMKRCHSGIMWSRYSWPHSSCGYLCNTEPCKHSIIGKESYCTPPRWANDTQDYWRSHTVFCHRTTDALPHL